MKLATNKFRKYIKVALALMILVLLIIQLICSIKLPTPQDILIRCSVNDIDTLEHLKRLG